ncbi:MAG: MATE family efflux transporter [Rhodospirillales bacterium]|nr:MATE family efflux transporter [Rhodospirillales bacterium]
MVMGFVDTVMVGRHSAEQLAYLGIGLAPITVLILVFVGLLMGTLVVTAATFGAGESAACGAVWRRSLPYALALGLAGAGICAFGEPLLLAFGQTPELAREGGAVVRVIGFGLPAYTLFLTTTFFLEGMRRPLPGMTMMIGGNLVNLGLNWIFVYGHLGAPALGAVGSAWATTGVRVFLALGLIAYVWTMADAARLGVRGGARFAWKAWRHQRRLGYAAAASIGIEGAAFSALNVFAGWLGVLPLAAFAIALNLISMVFMVAVGVGAATAVRVGMAHGRGDSAEVALAGWIGLAVCAVATAVFTAAFALAPAAIAAGYTTDPALGAAATPLIAFCAWILIVDGGQGVMANALRGRGETWAPTALHAVSYLAIMIPLAYILAFSAERGAMGLFEATFVASVVSVGVLSARFAWLGRRDREGADAKIEGQIEGQIEGR